MFESHFKITIVSNLFEGEDNQLRVKHVKHFIKEERYPEKGEKGIKEVIIHAYTKDEWDQK